MSNAPDDALRAGTTATGGHRPRRASPAAPLPVAILLAASLLGACTDRADPPERAPEVVFRTLDGARLALAEIEGPTLVNFWSTSCGVCLEEMPALSALYRDYAGQGFELVAVALPEDPPNAVLELAERHELPFPVALDIDGAVIEAFAPVVGTPTSFLIDAEGRVLERRIGALDVDATRERLDALLASADAPRIGAGAPGRLRPERVAGETRGEDPARQAIDEQRRPRRESTAAPRAEPVNAPMTAFASAVIGA